MPIWGYRFVSQFLEFGLPTLLAPGNLPAVARELPFRVVALTSEEDRPLIRTHPAWRRLEKICAADIEAIDDLITESNHSATMTLALARTMRSYGAAIVDTCFILWMSDYLSGDGSLAAVLRGFQTGVSGIFAGNFQIVAEDAIPSLRRSIERQSSVIAVTDRELLAWSLRHLHPATIANFVDSRLSHNGHTNRLFWRIDDETIIGRFYLMHPIGVRPETADFEIGSSFDYSFIPEMCPSGKILTLCDSDEYFVVEMQTEGHDHDKIFPGPLSKAKLAAQLSEWTTAQHRANAAHTLVFHAADEPASLTDAVAQADRYIADVAGLLAPQPQPHRDHHYWIGSIAVNRARTGRALTREDWQFLLEDSLPDSAPARLLLWLRFLIFGSLPKVTRLHPRWRDYRLLSRVIEKAVAEGDRLLLVAEDPRVFARWLARATVDAATVEIDRLLGASPLKYDALFKPIAGEFAACVVLLPERRFHHCGELLERIRPLLVPGALISIVALNERPAAVAPNFVPTFAHHSSRLLGLSRWIADARYVPASRVRWRIYRALRWFADNASRARWTSPALLGAPPAVALLSFLNCLTNLYAGTTRSPPRLASSLLVQLRLSGEGAHTPWASLSEKRIGAAPAAAEPVTLAPSADDPANVAAKYGFVGGLLARRSDVAAYGCGDDFGAEIVLKKVKKLSVYDPDPSRIGEISQKIFEPYRFDARVHNILDDPLPMVHDAIYNLDDLQYISPSDEDLYLLNLSRSLSGHQDILIIGLTPCDTDDDTATAVGHLSLRDDRDLNGNRPSGSRLLLHGRARYRRTSAGVRALLEHHFRTVSLFSMTAGVVQAGASETGDYLFALCSSKKN